MDDILLPILLFVDTAWVFTSGGIAVTLHLGLLATGLSYMLFGRSLQILPVSTVGTLTLVEPLTASLLGIFLLREQISLLAFVGIATLFAGLLVLVLRPTRKVQLKT